MSTPLRRGRQTSLPESPLFLAASPEEDRPHPGAPPVRLTNAPLLFVTTLSVAFGLSAPRSQPQRPPPSKAAAAPEAAAVEGPPPSSAEPPTERMPDLSSRG
jgi:hypothetical protein